MNARHVTLAGGLGILVALPFVTAALFHAFADSDPAVGLRLYGNGR